jgi:hypothetical protein
MSDTYTMSTTHIGPPHAPGRQRASPTRPSQPASENGTVPKGKAMLSNLRPVRATEPSH